MSLFFFFPVMPLSLQSHFAPTVMQSNKPACVSPLFVSPKAWTCWCWTLPLILIPGFVTSRYVILTAPRQSARTDNSTLTTTICWHWELRCCFIYILVLHLPMDRPPFWSKKKTNKKNIFGQQHIWEINYQLRDSLLGAWALLCRQTNAFQLSTFSL